MRLIVGGGMDGMGKGREGKGEGGRGKGEGGESRGREGGGKGRVSHMTVVASRCPLSRHSTARCAMRSENVVVTSIG